MSERIQLAEGIYIRMTYMEQYAIIHGYIDLIPEKWFYSKKYKSIEDVYKKCIETGKTWRELTGWNEDQKEDVLL